MQVKTLQLAQVILLMKIVLRFMINRNRKK